MAASPPMGEPRPPAIFRPGQIVHGRVESLLGTGQVVIRVGEMTLVAETRTELHAGDMVILRAGRQARPLRFQVVSRKSPGLGGLHVRV